MLKLLYKWAKMQIAKARFNFSPKGSGGQDNRKIKALQRISF
jgi:hypothetical protein